MARVIYWYFVRLALPSLIISYLKVILGGNGFVLDIYMCLHVCALSWVFYNQVLWLGSALANAASAFA